MPMPWKECTPMSEREELVRLARSEAVSITELARRFGVHRKTVHKWLKREREGDSLQEQSRRPQDSPAQTDAAIAAQVVALRRAHPRWGGRKLAKVLQNHGYEAVPAPSTITDICRRHGLIGAEASQASQPWHRFEHAQPNDLWQIDFKGTIQVGQRRCDPLTLLDDHSRFNLALRANRDMTQDTVQKELTAVFQRYGLPRRINMDNGSPWGNSRDPRTSLSQLAIWMVRLGIRVSYSGHYHPQTNGKDERFHRTFKAEVLGAPFSSFEEAQHAFDQWREIYNTLRPHQGIGMAVPADRYQPSPTPFPSVLPEPEYGPNDTVLRVRGHGRLYFGGRCTPLSMALSNHHVAVRPQPGRDGVYAVYFGHHFLIEIDLNQRDDV
jgi:transposase InsO family protein